MMIIMQLGMQPLVDKSNEEHQAEMMDLYILGIDHYLSCMQ